MCVCTRETPAQNDICPDDATPATGHKNALAAIFYPDARNPAPLLGKTTKKGGHSLDTF